MTQIREQIPRRSLILAIAALAAILLASAGTARAATPPRGAFTYVGNADDGARSGVVDRRNFVTGKTSTIRTALDGSDDMTAGDVLGDGFDELIVADDGKGRVDIHDTSSGDATSFSTRIGDDVFAFDSAGDDLTTGNIVGDGKDEVIVGDVDLDLIIVYSTTGKELKRLTNVAFDGNDRVVAGDFVPGRGSDEIAVVNSEDEGRIDVFDADENLLKKTHSGFDGDGDDVAAGDDTGDLVEEIIVANDEAGRIDSHDFATGKVHTTDSAYDSDDRMDAGDVTGDGKAEVVVANTENNRVDVINFFGKGGNFASAYDSDDRFSVGAFSSADIDDDSIPDRVELDGIRDDEGKLLLNLKSKGASPCRKDVVVEVASMTGHAPVAGVLDRVVATFAAAKEVKPVPNCPYANASTAEGMNLIIDDSNEEIPAQALVTGSAAIGKLIEKHFDLKAPFVRHSIWVDAFKADKGNLPAGQAGQGANDLGFVISLDGDTDPDAHESTFIHELGHSLGLDHGGATNDFVNCKPNHLSVMNYAFRGGVPFQDGGFKFDYSHEKLAELDETGLDERNGVGGPAAFKTLWTNGLGNIAESRASLRLDWDGKDSDGNGIANDDHGLEDEGVPVDLNLNDPLSKTTSVPCDDKELSPPGMTKLPSHNDWALLNTTIAGPEEVEAAETSPLVEPTPAQMSEAMVRRNQLLFPDAAIDVRAPKPGTTGDVLGVATDAAHVYALHNYRADATPGPVQGQGVLAVLDRATLTVQAQITVGLDARAVAVNPVTNRAYVVNRGIGQGSSLSVINTLTRKVIKEIALGQIAVDVAVNTKLNRVYVSNPTQEDLQIVNGATNTLLPPVQVGKGLGGLAVDEATGIVYISMTHRSSDPQFTALGRVRDSGTVRTVLGRIDLGDPLVQANDVAIDPARDRVYVGGLGGGGVQPSVTVLSASTGQQLGRIGMPGPVRAISINPQAGLLFAAGDRGVEVISQDTLAITRHIDAALPFSISTENGSSRQLYVGDLRDGKLRRLSYTSGEPR